MRKGEIVTLIRICCVRCMHTVMYQENKLQTAYYSHRNKSSTVLQGHYFFFFCNFQMNCTDLRKNKSLFQMAKNI